MRDLLDFLSLLMWLLQIIPFLVGFALGIALTVVLTPVAFRLQRRLVLRRRWKADRPAQVREGLYPEWQPYDPDIAGIAKRCVCHGRRVHPGERVLTWPETGPMNLLYIAVYCESVKERMYESHAQSADG